MKIKAAILVTIMTLLLSSIAVFGQDGMTSVIGNNLNNNDGNIPYLTTSRKGVEDSVPMTFYNGRRGTRNTTESKMYDIPGLGNFEWVKGDEKKFTMKVKFDGSNTDFFAIGVPKGLKLVNANKVRLKQYGTEWTIGHYGQGTNGGVQDVVLRENTLANGVKVPVYNTDWEFSKFYMRFLKYNPNESGKYLDYSQNSTTEGYGYWWNDKIDKPDSIVFEDPIIRSGNDEGRFDVWSHAYDIFTELDKMYVYKNNSWNGDWDKDPVELELDFEVTAPGMADGVTDFRNIKDSYRRLPIRFTAYKADNGLGHWWWSNWVRFSTAYYSYPTVYCYNKHYSTPPVGEGVDFSTLGYMEKQVPAPKAGSKLAMEWLLYLGYPYDGAKLLGDDHSTGDSKYGDLTFINRNAFSNYEEATQLAVYELSDGLYTNEPVARKLLEYAKEGAATGKRPQDFDKKFEAFYVDNNNQVNAQPNDGRKYQNFVGIKPFSAKKTEKFGLTISKKNEKGEPFTEGVVTFNILEGSYPDLSEIPTGEKLKEVLMSFKNPSGYVNDINAIYGNPIRLEDRFEVNRPYTIVEKNVDADGKYGPGDPTVFRFAETYNVEGANYMFNGHFTNKYRLEVLKKNDNDPAGIYKWVPVDAKDLFEHSNNVSENVKNLDIVNRPLKDVKIKKVDKSTGLPLKDAKLALYEGLNIENKPVDEWTNGRKPIDQWTTSGEDHTIKAAPYRKYTVVEKEAPEGFENLGYQSFEVDENGQIWLFNKVGNRYKAPSGDILVIENTRQGEISIDTTAIVNNVKSTKSTPVGHIRAGDSQSEHVVDQVDYAGLKANTKYRLTGSIHKIDKDGSVNAFKNIIAKSDFSTDEKSSGTIFVNFGDRRDYDNNSRYVIYETLEELDEKGNVVSQVFHNEKADLAQTFTIGPNPPENPFKVVIDTVVGLNVQNIATKDKPLELSEKNRSFWDYVRYNGLTQGEKYLLESKLVDITNINDIKELSVQRANVTAESSAGTWKVEFTDIAFANEHRYVVYETLLSSDGKTVLAVHNDPTDTEQSIDVKDTNAPAINTTIKVNDNLGNKFNPLEVKAKADDLNNKKITVSDIIEYKSLIEGKTYLAYAKLVEVNENGEEVKSVAEGRKEFKANKGSEFTKKNSVEVTLKNQDNNPQLEAGKKYVSLAIVVSKDLFKDKTPATYDELLKEVNDNKDPKKVIIHDNLSDVEESFVVKDNSLPSVKTIIKGSIDKANKAATGQLKTEKTPAKAAEIIATRDEIKDGINISDTIEYANLEKGRTYVVWGLLYEVDKDGNIVKVTENDENNRPNPVPKDNLVSTNKQVMVPQDEAGTIEINYGKINNLKANSRYVSVVAIAKVNDIINENSSYEAITKYLNTSAEARKYDGVVTSTKGEDAVSETLVVIPDREVNTYVSMLKGDNEIRSNELTPLREYSFDKTKKVEITDHVGYMGLKENSKEGKYKLFARLVEVKEESGKWVRANNDVVASKTEDVTAEESASLHDKHFDVDYQFTAENGKRYVSQVILVDLSDEAIKDKVGDFKSYENVEAFINNKANVDKIHGFIVHDDLNDAEETFEFTNPKAKLSTLVALKANDKEDEEGGTYPKGVGFTRSKDGYLTITTVNDKTPNGTTISDGLYGEHVPQGDYLVFGAIMEKTADKKDVVRDASNLPKIIAETKTEVTAHDTDKKQAFKKKNGEDITLDFDAGNKLEAGKTYVVHTIFLSKNADYTPKNYAEAREYIKIEDKAKYFVLDDVNDFSESFDVIRKPVMNTEVRVDDKGNTKDDNGNITSTEHKVTAREKEQGIDITDKITIKPFIKNRKGIIAAQLMEIEEKNGQQVAKPFKDKDGKTVEKVVTNNFSFEKLDQVNFELNDDGSASFDLKFGAVKGLEFGNKYVVYAVYKGGDNLKANDNYATLSNKDIFSDFEDILHADPNDKAETFVLKEEEEKQIAVNTVLTAEDKTATSEKAATLEFISGENTRTVSIKDKVQYKGLVDGKNYKLFAKLVDIDGDGNKTDVPNTYKIVNVTGKSGDSFVAERSVEIDYGKVDVKLGHKYVSYVILALDKVVTNGDTNYNEVHEKLKNLEADKLVLGGFDYVVDANDENKAEMLVTKEAPVIKTVAEVDGSKGTEASSVKANAGTNKIVKDTVTYSNLEAGKEYTLVGRLVKQNGAAIGHVKAVTKTFTAEDKANSSVELTFEGVTLENGKYIVYEYLIDKADITNPEDASFLLQGKSPAIGIGEKTYPILARHDDLSFTAQTIDVSETVKIEGTKTWDDNNDQDGKRPKEIKVKLMNGQQEVRTITTDASKNWKYSFENLPKYVGGIEANYIVQEEVVPEGYEAKVEGYNITNKHTPETVTIEGTKTWDDNNDQDGKRPKEIKVKLMNGQQEVRTITTDASKNWKYSFTNLPKYSEGKEITYTVNEEKVDGYTTKIKGYDITNILKTPIAVNTILEADANKASTENAVEITLAANETSKEVTVNDYVQYKGLEANKEYKLFAKLVKIKEVDGKETVTTATYKDGNNVEKTLEFTGKEGTEFTDDNKVTVEYGKVPVEPNTKYVSYVALVSADKVTADMTDFDKVVDANNKKAFAKSDLVIDNSNENKAETMVVVTKPEEPTPVANVIEIKTVVKAGDVSAIAATENEEAKPAELKTSEENTSITVPVKDTVIFEGLDNIKTYTFVAVLMDVTDTNKKVAVAAGKKEVTAEDIQAKTTEVDMGQGTLTAGHKYVAFEHLIEKPEGEVILPEKVEGDKTVLDLDKISVNNQGDKIKLILGENAYDLVANHADENDLAQTILVTKPEAPKPEPEKKEPNIKTLVLGSVNDQPANLLLGKQGFTVHDAVTYENLEKGAKYTLIGALMKVKAQPSGEAQPSQPEMIGKAMKTFTANDPSGTTLVPLPVSDDAAKLLQEGDKIVAFEYLIKGLDETETAEINKMLTDKNTTIQVEGEKVIVTSGDTVKTYDLVAEHADIESMPQTTIITKPPTGLVKVSDSGVLIAGAEFNVYKKVEKAETPVVDNAAAPATNNGAIPAEAAEEANTEAGEAVENTEATSVTDNAAAPVEATEETTVAHAPAVDEVKVLGETFKLLNSVMSNDKGIIDLSNLEDGKYFIQESKLPPTFGEGNWELDTNKYFVQVQDKTITFIKAVDKDDKEISELIGIKDGALIKIINKFIPKKPETPDNPPNKPEPPIIKIGTLIHVGDKTATPAKDGQKANKLSVEPGTYRVKDQIDYDLSGIDKAKTYYFVSQLVRLGKDHLGNVRNDIAKEEVVTVAVTGPVDTNKKEAYSDFGKINLISNSTYVIYEFLVEGDLNSDIDTIKKEGVISEGNLVVGEKKFPVIKEHKDPDDKAQTVTVSYKLGPIWPYFPDKPVKPNTPTPDKPKTPETPETPNTPDTPNTPNTPGTPEVPTVPEIPATPEIPSVPSTPGQTENPNGPKTPGSVDTGDDGATGELAIMGIGALLLGIIVSMRRKEK